MRYKELRGTRELSEGLKMLFLECDGWLYEGKHFTKQTIHLKMGTFTHIKVIQQ